MESSVSHIVPVLVADPHHCKMVSDLLLSDYGIMFSRSTIPPCRARHRAFPLHAGPRSTPMRRWEDLVTAGKPGPTAISFDSGGQAA